MKQLLIFLSLALLISTPVFATPNQPNQDVLLDQYDQIDALYYNPFGTNNEACATQIGFVENRASAGLSLIQSNFVDQYYPIASALGQQYGIPWEAVMAQGILESGAGTSNFAKTRNNFFGIGAFDSNPNNAYRYPTPEAGWRGYFENIKKTSVYRANGAFNFPNDPYNYIKAIAKAGYASDPAYINKVSGLATAVINRGKEKNWQLSANQPQSGNHASAPANITNPTDLPSNLTCNTLGIRGAVNGTIGANSKNINATALALSWPDRHHAKTDPHPAYRQALAVTGVNKLGDSCSMNGASCDAFVATVLRYSGADPSMPCCGVVNMLGYILAHPEKYREIPNLGNTSNLQPGDIRIRGNYQKPSNSHIELYVTLPSGESRIASASHCERTGDHARNFYKDSRYRIFRLIK